MWLPQNPWELLEVTTAANAVLQPLQRWLTGPTNQTHIGTRLFLLRTLTS
jgi:hypothetical protein